ncbi:MAG: hypothetical protein Q9214_003370, partial [Letrouitia sp. 1 TL-2023]
MTEDEIYRTSTQYRLWSFTPETLTSLRASTNASAAQAVRAAIEGLQDGSSGSKERDETQDDDPILHQRKSGSVDCLSVEEEQKLVGFYCVKTLEFVDFCEYPTVVKATAVQYLKRFYLTNSPMTYHPKEIMPTAVYLAMKTEDNFHYVKSFAEKLPNRTTEDILAPEFLLTQGLRFTFDVRHPFHGLEGGFMELMALTNGKGHAEPLITKSPQELRDDMMNIGVAPGASSKTSTPKAMITRIQAAHAKAKNTLKTSALLTDAYFFYTPSQIWLSALLLADEPLARFYVDTKLIAFPELKVRLFTTLQKCADLLRSSISTKPSREEKKELKRIDNKLVQCRNPQKLDLVSINKTQKRDPGKEDMLDEKVAKKRKLERERSPFVHYLRFMMGKPQPSEIDSSHDVDDMVYLSDDDNDHPPLGAEPGMFPKIKNLYPGERDDGRYSTSDKCPKDLPFLEETEETAKYALLIRNNKCYDGRRQLSISSIVVQNPALKKVISWVLKDYPLMNPNLDRLEIISPFRPFVHRWQCLTDTLNTEQDPETKSLIQLFYDALQQELRWTLEAREDFISHNTIAFHSLWMIFEPGTIILTTLNRRRAAGRLKSASFYSGKYEDYYRLEYEFITWNGQMFGWNTHRLDIREFDGLKTITDLNVFPLEFHPRADEVKKELTGMGKEFEKLKGFHHKQYEGVALSGSNPFYVDSRVIIDANTFNSFNPDQISTLEPITPPCGSKEYDEPASDRAIGRDWKRAPAITELRDVPALTEEQLMLCASTVKGYSLRNKRWLDFFVDSLTEIGWKDDAMSDVVLGTEQKHLVYSVVKNYTERIVQDKGMNFLISGESGVGKTMAIETAAECLHAPVFHLTNADIELEPDNPDLENPFTDILEMCANWKAVILYDSADKALDRNRVDDPENEESVDLVSFLRALESHFSLLFVTTTLEISPDVIGPRLLSRFHFTTEISYPDARTRKAIWEKHLQACGVSVFANPTALARWGLNGREISNAVTAARMLAGGGKLTTPFLESVVPKHKGLDFESDLSDDYVDEVPRDDGWDFTNTEKRVKKTKSKKPVENAPPLPLAAEERFYDFHESGRSKYKENIE